MVGARNGTRNVIKRIRTSPAKMLPNRRKVKLMMRMNSESSSRKPTKMLIGFQPLTKGGKAKNFPRYFGPRELSPQNSTKMNDMIAIASGEFASVFGLRR